jgi:type I restriction enzyme, S subunit
LNRGFDLPENNIVKGNYPIAASTSIKDYHKEFKVKAPCVTTGRSGSLGSVLYIDQDCWPLNTTLYVKNYKGNFPKYVYYFLQTMKLESFNCGAGVPSLNQNHLHRVKIKVHNKDEQPKIATFLTAYDDLIENNNRRIAILEQIAEQIYKEWFVRMRFPGWEETEFVKGIPKGWEVKKLSELIKLSYGKSLLDEKRDGGGYPVYGSSGIVGFHSKPIVQGPGIIVGRKGNVGSIFYSYTDFYAIDTAYYVETNLPLLYVLHLLSTIHFIDSDAAVPGLNRAQAYSNRVLFPGDQFVERFDQLITPIFEQKRNLQLQVKKLKQTRDLLLPRLISGKLRVKDVNVP